MARRAGNPVKPAVPGYPSVQRRNNDDAAAFAEAIRGVRRLRGGTAARLSPIPAAETGTVRQTQALTRHPAPKQTQPEKDSVLSVDDEGDFWTARADGVDRRLLRRLRAGEVKVESRLDLHGLTSAGAEQALDRFVTASRAAGHRCLLIIHGRGLHSGGARSGPSREVGLDGGPVLRGAVRAALTRGSHSSAVLAGCTAPSKLGGSGATIVLLRR